ncbi:hypothetical protein NQ257_25565, partial [Escherichia coli]|nr:hypothetical protein [Escherichia coli]
RDPEGLHQQGADRSQPGDVHAGLGPNQELDGQTISDRISLTISRTSTHFDRAGTPCKTLF